MRAFEASEAREQAARERLSQPDDDGFVMVTRKKKGTGEEDTKKKATSEKNVDSLVDPLRKDKPLSQDKALTLDSQMSYPLLKPIVFTNELDDDYLYSGVWSMKK